MNSKYRQTAAIAVAFLAWWSIGGAGIAVWAQEAPNEDAQIAVLQSDAGWLEKQTACRALRQVGTEKSVPALAALLPDPKLSHLARFALEAMPYPQASQALRDALAASDGAVRVGIVGSIGVRRDADAVPLLIPLVSGPDTALASAASGALGRIGTADAATALVTFLGTTPEAVQPAVREGLLTAGRHLVAEGRGAAAVPLYQALLAENQPLNVRMGAFRGLAYAEPGQAPVQLTAALGGEAPIFRDMAAEIVAESPETGATASYVEALPNLPVAGQAALLRGLAGRKDAAARPAAAQALKHEDKSVRLAAIAAFATLGQAEDVSILMPFLGSEDAQLADAVQESLSAMQTEGVDAALADAVPNAAPFAHARLLGVLGSRRAEQSVPLAVAAQSDADADVRVAGLRVLALLGEKDQAALVVGTIVKTNNKDESAAAEKALGAICSRSGAETLPAVLDGIKNAGPAPHAILLRALGLIGGPQALESVLAALKNADEQVSGEANRVLSNWATLDAAPALLEMAKSGDLNRQVLGIRGYVRLAGIEPSAENKAQMLTDIMQYTTRPDEKKLVLAGWGAIPNAQALDTLRPYLDESGLRNEAAFAMIAIAKELVKGDDAAKALAAAAVGDVVAKCPNPHIREKAEQALSGKK